MRSRKQPNKVKSYTSRQNQNINHSSNYNNTYDNSNSSNGMSQHSNNNNNSNSNKQNYNNMFQQQQQQPPHYQLMMTNSMMQIQSKQTKQPQLKEKESTDVNETNNNNSLPNKKHMYSQQIPRGTYNNKNTQLQYKEHHHHPHHQQHQNNSLNNSDSLNLSMSSETASQQPQSNQSLSRNSFLSERSSAPPPNYATFTPTYIINDPSFMSNYTLPINVYNPQSNMQMNQGKFPTFALGQNAQGNTSQVGVVQQKKPKTQVKGNQQQNIMLNMNYNNMMGIPFPIGVNNAVNMKSNWNTQQQQTNNNSNKNMPFNQGVANTSSMQNMMNNVSVNNNGSNVLQQHQQIKINNNNNKHHFMPFPRTVHSDKCIITTPDIFGKNYKQQYTNSNDNNNCTLHTQHKQIFNTINIKLKLPNNTSSSSNTEFKININDDIHKIINTHILNNNIDPKYTEAIYQKVLKGINILTSIPETKLRKTSIKTLHDIHNLNNLLSTTSPNDIIDNDIDNTTILDANTSFSYLIESTQYEKYISSLKLTTDDYEPYHKLTYSI